MVAIPTSLVLDSFQRSVEPRRILALRVQVNLLRTERSRALPKASKGRNVVCCNRVVGGRIGSDLIGGLHSFAFSIPCASSVPTHTRVTPVPTAFARTGIAQVVGANAI
jgi:hypothetical protein